jgi:hypothetical protein
MSQILFYTTEGCHLCDEAGQMLEQVCRVFPGMNWTAVEITEDAVLVEKYGLRIPLIRVQGCSMELGWPFDQATLASFLASQMVSPDGPAQAPGTD